MSNSRVKQRSAIIVPTWRDEGMMFMLRVKSGGEVVATEYYATFELAALSLYSMYAG